ncbi:endonuclease/exonuclease/phosphatase family protein, partial [Turicimonas muris]
MLRVITINTNGIRSASQKGFFNWMKEQNPDFVCIQELKAQESDISENIRNCPGYNFYAHYAAKKGYSGCA